MSRITLFISMGDFVPYVKDILLKNSASLFVDKRDKENNLEFIDINLEGSELPFEPNRQRYSNLYITTAAFDKNKGNFYVGPIGFYSMDITGGRITDTQVEIIEFRMLSKTPDKSIKKIFNAIQYRLKQDTEIGKGVRINTSVYKSIYFKKTHLDNKTFSLEFYLEKSYDIKPLEE